MTGRERFLAAAGRRAVDGPPVWFMRQAGRYLPEYRALRARHSFVEMVRTPDLAAEVTLQPLRRFPFDAAILFSDILVVPEALGQPYGFRDGGGIELAYALRGPADFARLDFAGVGERLAYQAQALRRLRAGLGAEKALLGFAGSPWTLACYMLEGRGGQEFAAARAFFREAPAAFAAFLERLAGAVAESLAQQLAAGADAVQLFDSWGGLCPAEDYEAMSLRWIREVLARLPAGAPVILFAKGCGGREAALAATGAAVLSLDAAADLPAVAARLPGVAVQGNLEPALLSGPPEPAAAAARALLGAMAGRPGHIFNLGHGILPDARLETVSAVLAEVLAARGDSRAVGLAPGGAPAN